MEFFYVTFTIVTLSGLVSAADKCPDIKPIADFNLTAYAQDVWYEIGRFYNNWESSGDCVTVTHAIDGAKMKFAINTVLNNKILKVEGTIKQDEGPGYLSYYTSAYTASENTNRIPAEIISIDYNKYAIVYFCGFDKKNNQHVYTWILSRTKKLDQRTKDLINQVFESTHFLDIKKIIWDHFDEKICKIN